MPSQILTSSNGVLLTTDAPTTLPLRGKCTVVPEELSGEWSFEADLPETPINHEHGADAQASSSSERLEEWAFLNEEVSRFCAGTTRAQSRGSSDWSSLASSALAAPKLEVDFPPSAGPLNFGGYTPIPSQEADLNLVNTGPPTRLVTGSYSRAAYETAEPSCSESNPSAFGSEPIHPLRFVAGSLPISSEPTMYSFSPHPSPSEEPREPFSQAPSTDPPTLRISSSQWLYTPFYSRNTPSRPDELLPNEPFSFFAPWHAPPFGPEHENSTVYGSLSAFDPGLSSSNGREPAPFAPGPSFKCPGRSLSIGPRPTSPIRPGTFSFHSCPSNDPQLPSNGPGPPPFGPGPSSTFGSELSTSFKQDPSLDYSSPIRDINFDSFSRSPSELPFGPGPSSILVNHMSVTRESEKPFLCPPCKRGFDRAELLERHKATKSHANTLVAEGIPFDPLPPPAVSCPFCDHIFNRRDNLRPHLLRHMGCDNQTRTRKVSVEDSIRMGLAHIDPRCTR